MSDRILLNNRIERLSQNLLEPRDVRRDLEVLFDKSAYQ
jgi:hypothetical protein